MTSYSRDQAAERAGVEAADVDRMVDLGILVPAEPARFSSGDIRRIQMGYAFEGAGSADRSSAR